MSLKSNMSDEFERNPLTIIIGACAVILAALSFLVAWAQYSGSILSVAQPTADNVNSQNLVNIGNLLLIISYYLTITISTAFLIRSLARKHDIAALVASVPLAALTNFSTLLIFYLVPPRNLTSESFSSAHDLLLYASAAAYVAFCGMPVLRDLVSPNTKKASTLDAEKTTETSDALAAIFFCFLLLAIWCALVSSGQKRLTQTLLPDVTHYIEALPSNSPPN